MMIDGLIEDGIPVGMMEDGMMEDGIRPPNIRMMETWNPIEDGTRQDSLVEDWKDGSNFLGRWNDRKLNDWNDKIPWRMESLEGWNDGGWNERIMEGGMIGNAADPYH